jgi:hypothetical protein
MKAEVRKKLEAINPKNADGVPIHNGNCQWCAIEAARVLLEDVEPTEIPSYNAKNPSSDPIERLIHSQYFAEEELDDDSADDDDEEASHTNGVQRFQASTRDVLVRKINELNTGELLLVNLGSDTVDHAYVIYQDESGPYLIDADRGVFEPIGVPEDFNFNRPVKGWDGVAKIDYLMARVELDEPDDEPEEEEDFTLGSFCLLNRDMIKGKPLPQPPKYTRQDTLEFKEKYQKALDALASGAAPTASTGTEEEVTLSGPSNL